MPENLNPNPIESEEESSNPQVRELVEKASSAFPYEGARFGAVSYILLDGLKKIPRESIEYKLYFC